MGWRERDWAKFTDDERDALFGGGIGGGIETSVRRKRRHSTVMVVVLVVAAVVAGAAAERVHAIDRLRSVDLSAALSHVKPGHGTPVLGLPHSDRSTLRIRWRAEDLAAASRPGRICVREPRHGRICASYTAGARPAETLTRRIEQLGLRVQTGP
ncbi:MAG: hypothetical protein ACJ76I_07020 [Gaiellaceae bacterium]